MWRQGIKLLHLIRMIRCVNMPKKTIKERFGEQEMVGLFMESTPHVGRDENITDSREEQDSQSSQNSNFSQNSGSNNQSQKSDNNDFVVIPDLIPIDKISTKNQILLDSYDGPIDYMKIDLSYFELAEISSNIGKFTKVGDINLSNNKLKTLNWAFANLVKVAKLNLHQNLLTFLPAIITSMKSLILLNLSCNYIDELPVEIGNLTNLKILILESNKFNEFPDAITQLRSLEYLSIANNNVKSIPPSIKNLKNLISLNLNKTDIKRLPREILEMKNLTISGLDIKQMEPFSMGNELGWYDIVKSNESKLYPVDKDLLNLTKKFVEIESSERLGWNISELSKLKALSVLRYGHSLIEIMDMISLILQENSSGESSDSSTNSGILTISSSNSKGTPISNGSSSNGSNSSKGSNNNSSKGPNSNSSSKGSNNNNSKSLSKFTDENNAINYRSFDDPTNNSRPSTSKSSDQNSYEIINDSIFCSSIINSNIVLSCNKGNLKHFTEMIISMAKDNCSFVEIIKNLLNSILIHLLRLKAAKYKALNTFLEELFCVGVAEHNKLIPDLIDLNYQLYCINTPYEEMVKRQSFDDFITDAIADIKEELIIYRLLRNVNRNTCSYLFHSISELDKYIGIGLSNVITQKELFSEFKQSFNVDSSTKNFHDSFFKLVTDFFSFFSPCYVSDELAKKIKDCGKLDDAYNFIYNKTSALEKMLVRSKYFLIDPANKIADIKTEGVEEILVQLNILKRNSRYESNILGIVSNPLKYFKTGMFK